MCSPLFHCKWHMFHSPFVASCCYCLKLMFSSDHGSSPRGFGSWYAAGDLFISLDGWQENSPSSFQQLSFRWVRFPAVSTPQLWHHSHPRPSSFPAWQPKGSAIQLDQGKHLCLWKTQPHHLFHPSEVFVGTKGPGKRAVLKTPILRRVTSILSAALLHKPLLPFQATSLQTTLWSPPCSPWLTPCKPLMPVTKP